eukprot:TRINITY_DN59483_c0_g2_i2.p2 TRINITY_DN59483_c0_g2~~TRINITY_DN59483_c0_g2_i2.p2  ORF type:complete len:175 (-),score=23.84 TRINITY_DN59483_c0_g2_i2:73-573(-)
MRPLRCTSVLLFCKIFCYLLQGMSEVLEKERQDLLLAIQHLQRSNTELYQVIKEYGPDVDYREAIGENIVAIAKKRSRIQQIEKELIAMGSEIIMTATEDQKDVINDNQLQKVDLHDQNQKQDQVPVEMDIDDFQQEQCVNQVNRGDCNQSQIQAQKLEDSRGRWL